MKSLSKQNGIGNSCLCNNVQQKPREATKVAGEATYVYAEVAGGWHLWGQGCHKSEGHKIMFGQLFCFAGIDNRAFLVKS